MSAVRTLRLVGITEGLSFLVLLFVAMPVKYLLGHAEVVRVVGMAHGLLFLALLAVLQRVALDRRWSIKSSARVFVAALLPFGFLAIDRFLRNEMARDAGAD